MGKIRYEATKTLQRAKKERNFVALVGGCIAWTALHVFEATCRQPGLTMCDKYSTRSCRKKHLRSFRVALASLRSARMALKFAMWAFFVFENNILSSKYKIANFHRTELYTISIACLKALGAFCRPNGILVKQNKPLCNTNVVLSLSCSSMGICQLPELQSNVLNMFPSDNV